MTEKMTDDDYNRTATKIMDTIPNETIEENFIIIENITNLDETINSFPFDHDCTLPDA